MAGVNLSAAGAVPNVGISLKILGMETRLMGKIGRDFFGEGILNFLKEKTVTGNMIETGGENTSYTVVIAPPGTDRMFLHDPGANDTFTSEDVDYEIMKSSRLFHFGYSPLMRKMYENDGEKLVKIFKRVKELGVITSLDMAFIEPSSDSGKADWKKILKRVLPFVDIYIPSVEETLYMVKRDYFYSLNKINQDIINNLNVNFMQELGDTLISHGAKVVVIKCGVKGYYTRTQGKKAFQEIEKLTFIDTENWTGRELFVETYDVERIKSTIGAGDTSIAGFLAALLTGRSIEESIKIAHVIATQSIQTYDIFSNIKDLGTTVEMVKKSMPVIRYEIEDSYWKYDKELGVWKGEKDREFV